MIIHFAYSFQKSCLFSSEQVGEFSHINITLLSCISFHYLSIHSHKNIRANNSIWTKVIRVANEIRCRSVVNLLNFCLDRFDSTHVSVRSCYWFAILIITLKAQSSTTVRIVAWMLARLAGNAIATLWNFFFIFFFALFTIALLFAIVILARSHPWFLSAYPWLLSANSRLSSTDFRFPSAHIWFLFA